MTQQPFNFEALPIPVNVSVDRQEAPRLQGQSQKILAMLRRGPATALDMINEAKALNYRARISELRGVGYRIEIDKTQTDLETGRRVYVLISEPDGV